jgi:hypothetical protein
LWRLRYNASRQREVIHPVPDPITDPDGEERDDG